MTLAIFLFCLFVAYCMAFIIPAIIKGLFSLFMYGA